MPAYELVLILRNMKKTDLVSAVKRTGEFLLKNNVVLWDLNYLGFKDLPHKMRSHGKMHLQGDYVLYKYDGPRDLLPTIKSELKRDVDVILGTCVNIRQPQQVECTLDEELRIPALRPSVQKLIQTGSRPSKPGYQGKTDGPF